MIWNNETIEEYVINHGLIHPYSAAAVRKNELGQEIPSYGLSACGYDVTGNGVWKLAKPTNEIRDILDSDKDEWYEEIHAESITIPAGGFVLTATKEYFRIPKNACSSLYGKSTLARSGIIVPFTICEPGWEGNLVIEIHNQMPFPVTIHANMGLGQMVFFYLNEETTIPYDKNRKYQGQTGVQVGK